MKRFLLLALTAGLFSPIAAKALNSEERFEICARYYSNQISYQETAKLLGLKATTISKEDRHFKLWSSLRTSVDSYCKYYAREY